MILINSHYVDESYNNIILPGPLFLNEISSEETFKCLLFTTLN